MYVGRTLRKTVNIGNKVNDDIFLKKNLNYRKKVRTAIQKNYKIKGQNCMKKVCDKAGIARKKSELQEINSELQDKLHQHCIVSIATN